jgi:hypothetical protein
MLLVSHLKGIETAKPEGDLSECLIRNQKYKYDFLYTADKVLIYQKKYFYLRKTNLMRLDKVDKFESLRWSISKAFSNDTYFIKSKLYPGNYLCALNEFQDLFKLKRSIQRLSVNSTDVKKLKSCEWKFESIGANKTTFSIWNKLYGTPLLPAKNPFSKVPARNEIVSILMEGRPVYLWYNSKVKITDELKWHIECQTGDYRWI